MAIGTTALITGGIMAATSAAQAISEAKAKKKNKQELNNLEVPELGNAFKDISVSTVGSDLMREESSRTNASLVDATRSGDFMNVLKAIPKITALNNDSNAKAQKYLDDQVIDRSYAIAGDEAKIRSMEENRYLGDVQGLNNAIQENKQNIWSGVRGIGSSLSYLGRNMQPGVRDSALGASELSSNGISGFGNQFSYQTPTSSATGMGIQAPFSTEMASADLPTKLTFS